MFQTATPLSPDLTQEEHLIAIREAYNTDRSQMTLMLAYKLRIPEVDVIRALDGDTTHELDFSRGEEIAKAVLFLAGDDSSFVTGHLLLVDGGNTAQ